MGSRRFWRGGSAQYLYEESKDFPKAIETYRYNIHLDPKFSDSHIHLGVLLYRLKQFPEAVTHLSEAVRLVPKQPEPYIVLGLAHVQSDQFEKATQAFEEGIRHHPKNADLHFNLGTAYDKLNRFEDVEQAMETALSLDPHHADALNYRGYSYAEQGEHLDEAIQLIRQALLIKRDNGYILDSLAWALSFMYLPDIVNAIRVASESMEHPAAGLEHPLRIIPDCPAHT